MSRGSSREENYSAKCLKKTLTRAPEDEGKILNPSQWSPIAENHYKIYDVNTNSFTKSDSPDQTDLPPPKHLLNPVVSSDTYFTEAARNLRDWPIDVEEYSDEEYPPQQSLYYGSHCTDQSIYGASMNNRKGMFDRSAASRGTDLERKKLEAELKAAQEIARIQQTVIEKRLALELASINNGKEGKDGRDNREHMPHPAHNVPKTQADLAFMEEVARRNGVMENNYVSEMEPPKSRPMMPKPVPSMSSNIQTSGGIQGFITPADINEAGLVNSERLRNGFANELMYKRSHSPETYGSGNSSPNGMLELQNPEVKYYKPSNPRMHRPPVPMPSQIPVQMASQRDEIYERPGWPGPQPRSRFSWKAFIGKMKRGFKNKPRDDWE